ncbi:MAG: SGNH/GDSL hydrolase family protein [Flavobacteriaceae bacterium]
MRKLSLKIVSILIGLFITFIIIELAYRIKLRFFGDYTVYSKTKEMVRYSENEKLLVELIPNASVEINKTSYNVNSLGYRDSEWNLKDTTKVKMGLISDSVGFPYGLNQEEGYEYFTELELAKDSIPTDIYNFSMNGYNAHQYIEVLKKVDATKEIQLDYLIANITSNDNQPTGTPSVLNWIDHPASKYEWIPSRLIKKFINIHYKKNVHPKLYSFSYIEEYIDYLKEYQDKNNTTVVVLLIPSNTTDQGNSDFYLKTKEYAKQKNLKTLFLKDKFDNMSKNESLKEYYYPNDIMHLSKKGHKFVAEHLSALLKSTIKQ